MAGDRRVEAAQRVVQENVASDDAGSRELTQEILAAADKADPLRQEAKAIVEDMKPWLDGNYVPPNRGTVRKWRNRLSRALEGESDD